VPVPSNHLIRPIRRCAAITGFVARLVTTMLVLTTATVGLPAHALPADTHTETADAGMIVRRLPGLVLPSLGSEVAAARMRGENLNWWDDATRWFRGRPEGRQEADGSFDELQLNLCDSGFAGCYRGGAAVLEGGNLVYDLAPDVVTVNEICLNAVQDYLQPSLALAWPNDRTFYVFVPAWDRRTNGPYKCRNGYDYGNVVIGRVPAASYRGIHSWAGIYAAQDPGDYEERTFGCAYVIGEHLVCVTHLAAHNPPTALAQCQELMLSAVPAISSAERLSGRTVVGGDLNLEYDPADPDNAQTCVPAGFTRKGDGALQHVTFSDDLGFESTTAYPMTQTDHDAFLVRMAMT